MLGIIACSIIETFGAVTSSTICNGARKRMSRSPHLCMKLLRQDRTRRHDSADGRSERQLCGPEVDDDGFWVLVVDVRQEFGDHVDGIGEE